MSALSKYLPDALGVLGAAAVLYGLAQWSVPLAWVIGGLMGIGLALRQALLEK